MHVLSTGAGRSLAAGTTVQFKDESPGSGTHSAQRGDLVMLHYVGTLPDGTVFDSTRGGLVRKQQGQQNITLDVEFIIHDFKDFQLHNIILQMT